MKFPTDSRNTAEDVSTVGRRAILSVTDYDDSRDKNIISVASFSGYGDVLVKEATKMFNTNTFMVTLRRHIAL